MTNQDIPAPLGAYPPEILVDLTEHQRESVEKANELISPMLLHLVNCEGFTASEAFAEKHIRKTIKMMERTDSGDIASAGGLVPWLKHHESLAKGLKKRRESFEKDYGVKLDIQEGEVVSTVRTPTATYPVIVNVVTKLSEEMVAELDLDTKLAIFLTKSRDIRKVVEENVGEVNADTLRGMANGYLLASIDASIKHRLYPYDKGRYDYEAKLEWLDGILHAVKLCDFAEQCLAELASRPPAKKARKKAVGEVLK